MSRVARPVQRLTVKLAAAVKAYRLVTWAGGVPAAGGAVMGPTCYAGATGERVDVVTLGTGTVEAGAAVAVGGEIQADANGRAVPQAANGKAAGVALEAASAAGDFIEVFIRTEH